MKPEYNNAEIFLTKEDWIEIYYALDTKMDLLNQHLPEEAKWIAHLEEIQQKIDHGQGG